MTIVKIIVVIICAYFFLIVLGNAWTRIWLRIHKNRPMTEIERKNLGLTGELKVNDRIWLSGGYDPDPEWLRGHDGYPGTVISFIPGQNEKPAAVIKLDQKIVVENVAGDILVLELRWKGAKWGDQGVVHLELCDFMPDHKEWKDRRQGKWIESHASYRKIGR